MVCDDCEIPNSPDLGGGILEAAFLGVTGIVFDAVEYMKNVHVDIKLSGGKEGWPTTFSEEEPFYIILCEDQKNWFLWPKDPTNSWQILDELLEWTAAGTTYERQKYHRTKLEAEINRQMELRKAQDSVNTTVQVHPFKPMLGNVIVVVAAGLTRINFPESSAVNVTSAVTSLMFHSLYCSP